MDIKVKQALCSNSWSVGKAFETLGLQFPIQEMGD